MTLQSLHETVFDKDKFTNISDFVKFGKRAIEFVDCRMQAQIVAKNEQNYCFYQFQKDGNFNVSRPVNQDLWISSDSIDQLDVFVELVQSDGKISVADRKLVQQAIYTIAQGIGVVLDGASSTNRARKNHGERFEQLCRVLIQLRGYTCESEQITIPFETNGVWDQMRYQLDLVIRDDEGDLLAIGNAKTTSKDRMDKVFLDQHIFKVLKGELVPHFTTILNDVQRAGREPNYRVASTFLSGRFKGLTVALGPLAGVFYCDPRPSMGNDPLLKECIGTIDTMMFDWLPTL